MLRISLKKMYSFIEFSYQIACTFITIEHEKIVSGKISDSSNGIFLYIPLKKNLLLIMFRLLHHDILQSVIPYNKSQSEPKIKTEPSFITVIQFSQHCIFARSVQIIEYLCIRFTLIHTKNTDQYLSNDINRINTSFGRNYSVNEKQSKSALPTAMYQTYGKRRTRNREKTKKASTKEPLGLPRAIMATICRKKTGGKVPQVYLFMIINIAGNQPQVLLSLTSICNVICVFYIVGKNVC